MGEITGRKVLIIAVCFFGVIMAVNFTMAFQAVRTFPGVEVENSYVASQSFDDRRAAQEALGWDVAAEYRRGQLFVIFTGRDGATPAVADLTALVGRTTTTEHDVRPDFRQAGGTFSAPVSLAPGLWRVRLEARASDGTPFQQWLSLDIREAAADDVTDDVTDDGA